MAIKAEHGAAQLAHLIASVLNAVAALAVLGLVACVWFHVQQTPTILAHAQAVVVRLRGR